MTLKLHFALYCAMLSFCSAMTFTTQAQGFAPSATNWGLPAGGEKYAGTDYSFRAIAYTTGAVDNIGSQSWTVADMNGDSKLDIVVYNENQTAGDAMVFSQNSNPYWKVYFGTATGFSQTATTWALPPGGEKEDGVTLGFHEFSAETGIGYDLGSQSYTVMDMNGDAKPDMVVYSENTDPGMRTFGSGSSFYWKVYLNTGSGFSQTATTWALPPGGEKDDNTNYSFRLINDQAYPNDDLNSESWSVMDMNGDSKPDMVVYSSNQTDDVLVFGSGNSRYWKVYLNTGSGFSQTAINWTLPAGGEKDYNTDYNFRHITDQAYPNDDLNSESWTVMDMNGDSKLDLLVYSSNQTDDVLVFGSGSSKYWKVFLNTGTGFSTTATNWMLPAGGEKYSGSSYSFRNPYYSTGPVDDLGSQSWTIMDLNEDSKPELVIYNENQAAGDALVYGTGSSRYWKAYQNNGSGFSTTVSNWSLPAGGETYDGVNYSFRAIAYNTGPVDDNGSQSWTVMDMNGDHKPDLVAYNEMQGDDDELVYGSGGNKYWKVYLSSGVLDVATRQLQASFVAYPNPVSGVLHIQAEAAFAYASYSLVDTNGRTVSGGELSGEHSTIDMSGMARGLYFLKVDGANQAMKVMKQ